MICFDKCIPYWEFIFIVLFFGSLFFSVISLVILRFTLDRRVRRSLPLNKEYNSPLDFNFGFMRVIGFSYAVVSDWANNSHMIKDYYCGFDVKSFANLFERFLSFVFVISGSFLVFGAVFYLVTKYSGLLQWAVPA